MRVADSGVLVRQPGRPDKRVPAPGRATRRQPAISKAADAWPPARVAAFWARRYQILMRASEDAELVAEALRIVGRSEVLARMRGGVPVSFADALVDLYVHAHHDRFAPGRRRGAVGPIRRAIRAALARAPGASTAELWRMVAAAPPHGWTLHDNRAGRYAEGPEAGQNVDYRAFANHASAERRARKSSNSGAMNRG